MIESFTIWNLTIRNNYRFRTIVDDDASWVTNGIRLGTSLRNRVSERLYYNSLNGKRDTNVGDGEGGGGVDIPNIVQIQDENL